MFTCFINEVDQICSINPDGSEYTQLTDASLTSWYASLSFDGQQIFFSSRRSGIYEIYHMNFDGDNLSPCFSPDGQWLVFSSRRDGDLEIYTMRPDGSQVTQLTFNGYSDYQPWWER